VLMNSRLIVIALLERDAPEPTYFTTQLRTSGATVCVTHGSDGCLRVATAAGPTIIYLDPRLPKRLAKLLHAHPSTARATLMELGAG
jgi:hypothetical protein